MSGWAASAAGFGPLEVALAALVALVGALLIHNLGRGRRGLPVSDDRVMPPASAPVGETDLPELRAAMHDAARRMDLPERLLPRLALPAGNEGDFVYREAATYVYCALERGTRIAEYRSDALDELLYRVFKDRAWTRTYVGLIGQELSPQEHDTRLRAGQLELLGKADPAWADRLRGDSE